MNKFKFYIEEHKESIIILNKIKDIEVKEIENCGESWRIKIKLNGKANNIIKNIEELKNFTVKTYNINGKDNNLLTILELNR